jgi:outer membrane protein assembly factor BamB/tetratricopeptide (TPR) repeat protein
MWVSARTCAVALAQADVTDEDRRDGEPESKPPFVVPAAKIDALEALEDFRKAVRKSKWDIAFKQLETLSGDAATGLVPRKAGLWMPLRSALANDLAQLPPAGQHAYRLFHDAEAKTLWDQAQKENGAAEIEKLSRLATLELITSVGDLAADRLGELLFEQGDMTGAIEAWQRILTYRPDSTLSRPLLLAKVGVALARAGRWEELEELQRQLEERHAGEKVVLGGKQVVAAEHVAALRAQHRSGAANDSSGPPDLLLGDQTEPVWQFRFQSSDPNLRPRVQRFNPWMGSELQNLEMVMPVEVIGDSLYGNWLGCDFAIDLGTGKLRWRNGRFHDIAQRMRQGNWVDTDHFALGVASDQLWLITQATPSNPQQPQRHQGGDFQLLQRDLMTGKERFNSKQSEALKQYVPVGSPLSDGNVVYMTAYKQNQPTELHVLAVKISTGHLQWTTMVGTYQFSQQQSRYYYQSAPRSTKPMMLLRGARLYIDSHAGGLVELETGTGRIRWAYSYPSKSPEGNNMWWDYQPPPTYNPSAPLESNGLLFVKGMRSSRLTALKLDGTGVAWKRAVPDAAMLVGADEERIYLSGEEVLALDRKTQRLLWANRLPPATPWMQPLVTRNKYYQFTPRGVYELDKRTGDVLRLFRGTDLSAAGGAILATSQLLITVSSQAVTAYRLRANSETTTASVSSDPRN